MEHGKNTRNAMNGVGHLWYVERVKKGNVGTGTFTLTDALTNMPTAIGGKDVIYTGEVTSY